MKTSVLEQAWSKMFSFKGILHPKSCKKTFFQNLNTFICSHEQKVKIFGKMLAMDKDYYSRKNH